MINLLFIHGFAATPKIWDLQIKEFSKDFTVLTNSDDIEPENDTVVIGWSLGGIAAIDFYFNHKESVKALVLVSSFPKFLKSEDYKEGLSPALLRNLEKKLDVNIHSGLKFFYELVFPDKNMHHLFRGMPTPGRDNIFSQIHQLRTIDIRSRLSEIEVPTLLIHGDCDQIVPLKSAEYMRQNIISSELYIFEGVGHAPFLERAKYFNSCLRDFIKHNA